jgi:hypothetical protein
VDHVILIENDLPRENNFAAENARLGAADLYSEPLPLLFRYTQTFARMRAVIMTLVIVMVRLFGIMLFVRIRAVIMPLMVGLFGIVIFLNIRVVIMTLVVIMARLFGIVTFLRIRVVFMTLVVIMVADL